jgi:hypothetical protein
LLECRVPWAARSMAESILDAGNTIGDGPLTSVVR